MAHFFGAKGGEAWFHPRVSSAAVALPDDVAVLKTALLEATTRALQVEAELVNARARASDDQTTIAHQQLQIAKLQHQLYGQKSERAVRLLDHINFVLGSPPTQPGRLAAPREKSRE